MTVRTIPGKVVYNGQECVLVKKFEHSIGNVTFTIGTIPANSIVTGAGVVVTTAFAGGTPPTLDLGTSADPDGFATNLVLSTAGNIVADELASSDDLGPYTAETTIVGVTESGVTTSAGVGYVYIRYIPLTPV